MANWIQWARDMAVIGLKDPKVAVKIKTRRDELLSATLTDGGLDKLQSASKNGVSQTIQTGGNSAFSKSDELAALQQACEWIEQGAVPSRSRAMGRF